MSQISQHTPSFWNIFGFSLKLQRKAPRLPRPRPGRIQLTVTQLILSSCHYGWV